MFSVSRLSIVLWRNPIEKCLCDCSEIVFNRFNNNVPCKSLFWWIYNYSIHKICYKSILNCRLPVLYWIYPCYLEYCTFHKYLWFSIYLCMLLYVKCTVWFILNSHFCCINNASYFHRLRKTDWLYITNIFVNPGCYQYDSLRSYHKIHVICWTQFVKFGTYMLAVSKI